MTVGTAARNKSPSWPKISTDYERASDNARLYVSPVTLKCTPALRLMLAGQRSDFIASDGDSRKPKSDLIGTDRQGRTFTASFERFQLPACLCANPDAASAGYPEALSPFCVRALSSRGDHGLRATASSAMALFQDVAESASACWGETRRARMLACPAIPLEKLALPAFSPMRSQDRRST